MLDLTTWNPFDDRSFRSLVNRAMRPALFDDTNTTEPLYLDIYEQNGNLYVKAAMPGLDMKDIKVTVEGNILTIRGDRTDDKTVKDNDYYLREWRSGSWSRSVRLPPDVKLDKAAASFDKGVLVVSFPMLNTTTPRAIEVKVQPTH